MTDSPPRAQSTLLGDDLVHQHVGVEAPLHQALRLAVADQAHRGGRGFLLSCDIHSRETADVEAGFLCHGADPLGWSDQNRHDDVLLGGVDRASQRVLLARPDDCRRDRGNTLRQCDQALVLLVRLFRSGRGRIGRVGRIGGGLDRSVGIHGF